MSHRQSIRAIVIRDNALLVMKRNKFGMEFYTLIGGAIELGEEPEHALRRELHEEAGLQVGNVRPVFMEDGGPVYGVQYVYLCEDQGGEPQMQPHTIEAQLSAAGQNTYTPMWLPLSQLTQVPFRSSSVRDAIVTAIRSGFQKPRRYLPGSPKV